MLTIHEMAARYVLDKLAHKDSPNRFVHQKRGYEPILVIGIARHTAPANSLHKYFKTSEISRQKLIIIKLQVKTNFFFWIGKFPP